MTIFDRPHADFLNNPVYFVELAREWAAGGPAPSEEHTQWLNDLPRPLFAKPAVAREAFWGVLSYPERGRALSWLDRVGILGELIPSWNDFSVPHVVQHKAVEEVHLERWAALLSATTFDWLCVYQDQKVDGRLSGWAVTGLSTLLLGEEQEADSFAARVEADLKKLGAHSGERERVAAAIREYPNLVKFLLSGKNGTGGFTPNGIIATLSAIWSMEDVSEAQRTRAAALADKLLLRYAAPDAANSALFFHAP